MKKKLIILLLVLALLPVKVFASGVDNYKENDKQAVIYMFRGQGCGFCRAFLTYLYTIAEDYGDKFKLVSFEVWYDETNKGLFEKVLNHNGDDPAKSGVPYIIIGEKIFRGYSSEWNQDIIDAIETQYKNPSHDLMKDMKVNISDYAHMNLIETLNAEQLPEEEKEVEPTNNSSSGGSFATIFWNAFFVVAATVAIIIVNNNNTKKVLAVVENKKKKKKKEVVEKPKNKKK